ncbi:pca operon transcription factor PcaQ [Oricola sp.]|uniref:pca operon transcription factor PcaQ n=1 Tax=Oricola sp. TaxID=1979950 RepID=UPI003BAC907B
MIDRRIKFRHIQCFVEIARERSLKRAAQKLHLTQPAISKTLKELEEILDRQLLVRSRAGVDLTTEGATFLRSAQMSIAALQQGLDGLHADAHGAQLAIGVLPSVAARLIPDVASVFGELAPNVTLRVQDGPHLHLMNRLKLGEIDVVIGRMGDHEQMAGVTFTRLYREAVVLVVRAGHPLINDPVLANIRNWPIVYPPPGSAIRPLADRFMIESGIGTLPRRIETVSGAFGRVYVRRSDAVWIISEGVVANEIADGVLVRLPFNMETTLGPIGIMTREDGELPPSARLFRDAVHRCIGSAANITH